ncbi:MAG: OmpA family protein [Agriterribacter sp.]
MKTLLIISGIVLLSLQANNIFTDHSNSNLLKSEAVAYDKEAALTPIDSTYRSAKSLKVVNAPVAKANKSDIASTHNTVHRAALKKYNTHYSTSKNNDAKMLHRLIKESGAFRSFTIMQFDFNKHDHLSTKEFNTIMQYANQLIFNRALKISVAGFSDNVGTVDANEYISWLRAQNIKKYLQELGVNEDQIVISANGIGDPVAGNATEFGRSLNRRVELAIIE